MAMKKGAKYKDGGDDYDAWGMGQKFTVVKFLDPLKDFTHAAKMARYGFIEGESIYNHPFYKVENRLEGLDRMYFIMITLSYDVIPFLNKYVKRKMMSLRKRIQIIKKLLKFVSNTNVNQVSNQNTTVINDETFEICFETLLDINAHMIEIMNQTGFIFRLRDEVTMDEFVEDVVHGG